MKIGEYKTINNSNNAVIKTQNVTFGNSISKNSTERQTIKSNDVVIGDTIEFEKMTYTPRYLEIRRVFEKGKELYGARRIKKALLEDTGWIIN